jgi:hypothetical protein
MIRKRAPGGGRKRSPHAPRAQLTVRMPGDLRTELEAAAQKRGHTLTDELVARLRSSLSRERDNERDPAIKALNFVIAQLAERISGGAYVTEKESRLQQLKEWRTDPFKFGAFKFAVGKLLDVLEPPEIPQDYPLSKAELAAIKEKVRKEAAKEAVEKFGSTPEFEKFMIEIHKTPEAYGGFAFGALWAQLKRTNPLTEKEKEMGHRFSRFGEVIEREFYGFEKARHDLGIDEPEGPKP